jgi:hypothetical protein
MTRRKQLAVIGITVTALLLVAAYFTFPRLKVYSLERQLREASSPAKACGIVRKLLECGSDRAYDVVAEYASESSLRSFDRDHRIFRLHDSSTGVTHEVLVCPQGTVEVQDSSLTNKDKEAIAKAVQAAMPRTTSESFIIGKPRTIMSGVYHVGTKQNAQGEAEKTTFVFKERGSAKYHAVVIEFKEGRLIGEGFRDVSEADLRKWQQADSWPQEWR